MVIVINSASSGLWIQAILAFFTLLLFLATFLMAKASYKNIAVAAKIGDRAWRPLLAIKFSQQGMSPQPHPQEDHLYQLLTLKNIGGSEALHVKWKAYVNSEQSPNKPPAHYQDEKDIFLPSRSQDTIPLRFEWLPNALKEKEEVFFHIAVLYKDTEGKEYKREAVFPVTYCRGVPATDGSFYNPHIYDWVEDDFWWRRGKWVYIGLMDEKVFARYS